MNVFTTLKFSLLKPIVSLVGIASTIISFGCAPEAEASTVDIPVDFCISSATWVRPSSQEQAEHLRAVNRYGNINENSLSRFLGWSSDFIVYRNYYGLSGLLDISRIAGLWSLRERDMESKGVRGLSECNSDFANPSEGEFQVWSFSHKILSVVWTGERYIITAQPTGQGVQIFQFPKQVAESLSFDADPSQLPAIEVVDKTGVTLYTCEPGEGSIYRTVCQ